ncbi:hypothetical protein W02_02030 [Nitrospira sp. KM1]|uniref:hypothetical protein n=1 Tax=Nitrospira sp. KM1 TaxID=1936990 RepID=UPI0013A7AC85|nr:hypothetical protein [Nitrospira sp. KM1]BCA53063.1 hypothetical protein W02_02030 [Nitrospira sp. KM1]
MNEAGNGHDEVTFSLIRNDPWFRLQRTLGLIPAQGLGIVRRCGVFAMITWLPIAIWAIWWRRAFPGEIAEPLLQHFGIHVRCLLAIPLFIIAEMTADRTFREAIPYFGRSGIIDDDKPRFIQILRSADRMRDAWYVWSSMFAIMLLVVLVGDQEAMHLHELVWADEGAPGRQHLGFGGWWFLFVMRPLFVWLLLVWVWRLVVSTVLLWRISRLTLHLVPTHPDRAGGLGFLEDLSMVFSPVIFALSAVLASRWGHEVLYHGVDVHSFTMPFALFVASMLVLIVGPLTLFVPQLLRLKRQALADYSDLVGRHGRQVHRRWISRKPVTEEPLLQAAELGPVIDTVSMYEVVDQIRPAPIARKALLAVVLPALFPMIPMVATQIPLKDVMLKLLETLV